MAVASLESSSEHCAEAVTDARNSSAFFLSACGIKLKRRNGMTYGHDFRQSLVFKIFGFYQKQKTFFSNTFKKEYTSVLKVG